jgi:hypothetical protein
MVLLLAELFARLGCRSDVILGLKRERERVRV